MYEDDCDDDGDAFSERQAVRPETLGGTPARDELYAPLRPSAHPLVEGGFSTTFFFHTITLSRT